MNDFSCYVFTADFQDKQTFFIKKLCDNINQAMKKNDNLTKSEDHIWLTGEVLEKKLFVSFIMKRRLSKFIGFIHK